MMNLFNIVHVKGNQELTNVFYSLLGSQIEGVPDHELTTFCCILGMFMCKDV